MKFQNLIDIVGHYARRYGLLFAADKTKVTVTASKHDVNYYKDIPIWSLNRKQIKVTKNNEHLVLINSMFAFFGNAFSFKCICTIRIENNLERIKTKRKSKFHFFYVLSNEWHIRICAL